MDADRVVTASLFEPVKEADVVATIRDIITSVVVNIYEL
jgi:hypothetical protein